MKKQRNFVVIIPAYNEAETIKEVVLRAKRYADVCVINDNSSDRTPEILASIEGIHVIHHKQNTHIPGGVRDGMKYALQCGYDYAITMDAGLSHNPDEIPRFIEHHHSDLVIGIRTEKIDTPFFRKCLSASGNLIYNSVLDFPWSLLQGKYLKDVTSGFRRYSKSAMDAVLAQDLKSRSFDIMIETVSRIYRQNLMISEVPISYQFSNSSLNTKVVSDCLKMSLKLIFSKK
jgi:dolichol-phosphate mannosyltransferase